MKAHIIRGLEPDDDNVVLSEDQAGIITVHLNGTKMGFVEMKVAHTAAPWRATTVDGDVSRHWSLTAAYEHLQTTKPRTK